MEQAKSRKMFSCPQCGTVEVCFVHGDWIDRTTMQDMVFEVARIDWDNYEAKVSDRSITKPDGLSAPRILAAVEDYCAEKHQFQCQSCGKVFIIPEKNKKDSSQVSSAPGVLINPSPGPTGPAPSTPQTTTPWTPFGNIAGTQRSAIFAWIDLKFSEQELDLILTDVGDDPTNYGSKGDKIDGILDRLY